MSARRKTDGALHRALLCSFASRGVINIRDQGLILEPGQLGGAQETSLPLPPEGFPQDLRMRALWQVATVRRQVPKAHWVSAFATPAAVPALAEQGVELGDDWEGQMRERVRWLARTFLADAGLTVLYMENQSAI
jgi:hypothetical protein